MSQYRDNFFPSYYLSVLAKSDDQKLSCFVDDEILVNGLNVKIQEKTCGLLMAPARDTVKGVQFFLGEVIVTRARVECDHIPGFGMCLGRNYKKAIAIAILDACVKSDRFHESIQEFVDGSYKDQALEHDEERRLVESTRVEMETF